jgi:hypothetical protein
MTAANPSALEWAIDHLSLVGWPTLLAITWKFKGAFDKYLNGIAEVQKKTASTEQVTGEIKRNLEVVQNNHLAHLAEDIKGVGAQYEKHTELLTSIDRGIAILVDRSGSQRGK